MHPKLFASLLEAVEKWSESVCKTDEWSKKGFYYPDDADLNMAKAAAVVFDAVVSASVQAEAEASA